MSYSTGQLAELCGVTVRAVQYYDREGLLKPEGYSEGGRRLYGEEGLKTLQIICMYRELGLSLTEIKEVISDEANSKKILLAVLAEREKHLDEEIKQKLSQRDSVKVIRQYLADGAAMSRNSFFDVRTIMNGKKRYRTAIGVMIVLSIIALLAETAFIVLWAVKGWWLPFAIGVPCVFAMLAAMVGVYYKCAAYICSECGEKFVPRFWEFFFAGHTPRTRKLTCPHCGAKKYHLETYRDE